MARVLNKFQFGIELECFVPYSNNSIDFSENKEQLLKRLTDHHIAMGYDAEVAVSYAERAIANYNYNSLDNLTSFNHEMRVAGIDVGTDGSISPPSDFNGYEVRGGVFNEDNIVEKVTAITTIAKKHKADVNKTCGFHVHTSHKKFLERVNIVRLVHVWSAIEDVLFLTQPQSRFNNRYCFRLLKPFIWGSFDDLPVQKRELAEKLGQADRYTSLNLTALKKYHTVEVRLHSGTLDKEKILNWIELLKAIYTYVFNSYDKIEVQKVFEMPINKEKVEYVFNLLKLSDEVKAHFTDRIDRFYTEDNWKIYTDKLAKQNADANNALIEKQTLIEKKKRVELARKRYETANSELSNARTAFDRVVGSLQ